jgi:hypothetical protein
MTDQALNDGTLSIVVRKVVKVKFGKGHYINKEVGAHFMTVFGACGDERSQPSSAIRSQFCRCLPPHGSWSRAFDACFYVFVVSSIVFLLVETKSILFYSVSELLQSQ